jgi:acyl-CoA dehydrogenase
VTDPLITRAAQDLFRRHCPPETVRQAEPAGWAPELWHELEVSGLAAAGTELPLGDAADLVRVAASFAAPVPLAETILVGWLCGCDVPPGPLTVAFRGRAPYGRVAAAILSAGGFVAGGGRPPA